MLRPTLTRKHWSNGLAPLGAPALPSRAFAPEIRAARAARRNQEAAGAVGSRAFARSGGRRETFSSKVRHFSGTQRVLWASFRRISGKNECRPGVAPAGVSRKPARSFPSPVVQARIARQAFFPSPLAAARNSAENCRTYAGAG